MGSFETMVVLLVLISSVTSVIKQRQKTSRKDLALLVDEVRALKDEVRQLRSQNNDVVLALDHTVHRIDRRVSHLETRSSLSPGEERSFTSR